MKTIRYEVSNGLKIRIPYNKSEMERDYKEMKELGIEFVRAPKVQDYGKVAVFKDLYGNLWDLVQFNSDHPMYQRVK